MGFDDDQISNLDVTTKKINEIVKFLMYAMYMFNKDEPQWLLVIVGLNIVKKTLRRGWLTKWPGRVVTKTSRTPAIDTR
jgi:hypothetical protein